MTMFISETHKRIFIDQQVRILKTTARKMLLFEIRRKEFRVVLCSKKPVMLFANACAIRRTAPCNRRLDSSWSVSGHDRFDIPLCERSALLTAEDLQQHRNPLGPGQASIHRQMPAERAGQNFDAVSVLEPTLGKRGGPIALAAADLLDYGIEHPRRLQPVHH